MNPLANRSEPLVRMLKGVLRAPQTAPTARELVYEIHRIRLYRYHGVSGESQKQPGSRPPLLIVPSIINRAFVLDLTEKRSLIAHLVRSGFDVFLLEWGAPADHDRKTPAENYLDHYLRFCHHRIQELSGQKKLHMLGHCLGGTFALCYAAMYPQAVSSLSLITSPVDFSPEGPLKTWTEHLDENALIAGYGNAPWPLLQLAFHALKPSIILQKLWHAEKLFKGDQLALEIWSNDNVSIPGQLFRFLIKELYRENRLIQGELKVGSKSVHLSEVKCPVSCWAFKDDHIVAPESALALGEHIPGIQQYLTPGGHIGGLVGRNAAQTVWPQITDFVSNSQKEYLH